MFKMRAPKLSLAGLLILGLVIGGAQAASASSVNNLALAVTAGPFKHSIKTSYQVNNEVSGGTIGDSNQARAFSYDCTGCTTVAVAIQIDLATGPVVGLTGVNVATSTTQRGSYDDTASYAVQYIIAPSQQVVFTPGCTIAIQGVFAHVSTIVHTEALTQRDADVTAATDGLNGILSDPGCYQPGTPTGPPLVVTVNQRRVIG